MTRRILLFAAFAPPVQFAGTFLQLNSGHSAWSAAQWDDLFDYLKRLRLPRIILQWTAYEDVSFVSLLPSILQHAETAGMRVTLGLRHEQAFWTRNRENRAAAFAGLYERTRPLLETLAPLAKHPVVDGWYIPQEFDDVNWSRKDARGAGGDYLRAMAREVRRIVSGSRVSVSAFANGTMPPQELARLWESIVRYARLDELLFQDGVGAQKLSIEQASSYICSLHERLGSKITPVVETFEQIREQPFEARPATLDRIRRQAASFAACGTARPVVFSAPEYMTPLGGPAAAALFRELEGG